MFKIENLNSLLLNQLTSEIIVLNEDLDILWLNDSAASSGWIVLTDKKNPIKEQFLEKTSNELAKLLGECISSKNSITKRDFELEKSNESRRIVDLTVSSSHSDNILILEILSLEYLNKIIVWKIVVKFAELIPKTIRF